MEEEKTARERIRKAYAPDGSKSQKMFAFRLDNDLREWLDSQPNKGRYLNDLIREDRDRASAL